MLCTGQAVGPDLCMVASKSYTDLCFFVWSHRNPILVYVLCAPLFGSDLRLSLIFSNSAYSLSVIRPALSFFSFIRLPPWAVRNSYHTLFSSFISVFPIHPPATYSATSATSQLGQKGTTPPCLDCTFEATTLRITDTPTSTNTTMACRSGSTGGERSPWLSATWMSLTCGTTHVSTGGAR